MATGSFIHHFDSNSAATQQFASPREIMETGDPVQFVVNQIRISSQVATALTVGVSVVDSDGAVFLLQRQVAISATVATIDLFNDRLRLSADQRVRVTVDRALVGDEFLDILIGHEYQSLLGPTVTWNRIDNKPTEFPPAPHYHDVSAIASGTFGIARLPALPTSQITGLDAALAGKAASVHTHDVSAIASGTFAIAQLPALPTSQITGLDAALAGKAALTGSTFTGPLIAPKITLNDATTASSATTGAFILPKIAMGNGKIYADSMNLSGGASIAGTADANFAWIWTDIPNISNKDIFFRWSYVGTNNAGTGKQVVYEFGRGNGNRNFIFQAASHNTTNEMSFTVAAQNVQFVGLPTSATGLSAGQLYKDPATKTIKYV